MLTHVKTLTILAFLVSFLSGGVATAQIPDKFENLKVLPKDIGKRELVNIMRGFASGLGVRCNYCHVGENPANLEGYDFKSDEKDHKRTAREMMKMVGAINNDHLAGMDIKNPTKVRCITCHRGLEDPETLDNILLAEAEKFGAEKAENRYRELREEHYGSSAYDFGSSTLSGVAESLAATDIDGAVAMANLLVEFNPDDAFAHLLLGQLHMRKGDKKAAIKSIERSLEINPDNKWAERALKQAKDAE